MIDGQVLYLGRWVSREHFRAFVYNNEGQKLAKSYQEFSDLVSSGLWSAEKAVPETKPEETNVIDIKPNRGRKCRSQHNR